MRDSRALLIKSTTDFPALRRVGARILQVNVGYLCNLSCVHCHVNAGPTRTEMMDEATLELLLSVIEKGGFTTLDLTGGAPEMHLGFRRLIHAARAKGLEVIDRCNLTILLEPGYEDMAAFLAEEGVRIVASLPCYQQENVEKQRGKGVYADSIEALMLLNKLGYGIAGSGLILDLVYNPGGASLPPAQQALEQDYKRELATRFDIQFNQLLTITNMPISRFGAVLLAHDEFDPYMELLRENYNAATVPALMCRDTVSVDYLGNLYDCDFNQMLALPLRAQGKERYLSDLLNSDFAGNDIAVADHCFGCTAGAGSSCGGALS